VANCQAVYGSVFGTVVDPSGAAVAVAEITVTSLQKGTKFHTHSNSSGNYSITHLIPDAYDVRCQAPGFKVVDLTNISIYADQTARVDINLQVGGTEEQLTVFAGDLGLLLDHLGIGSTHLVGHSFGGAVALAFAIQQPHRIRTLTLADAWIPTLQAAPLARNRLRWRRLQSELRRSGFSVDQELPTAVHDFLEEVTKLRDRNDAQPDGFRALGTLLNRDGDSMALRRWWQLVRMTSAVNEFPDETGLSRAEIGRVQQPASIVFGKQSRYLPTMQGLEATLANCRSTIIPNAGHYFPVLNPEVFTRAVDSFAGEYDRA